MAVASNGSGKKKTLASEQEKDKALRNSGRQSEPHKLGDILPKIARAS